MNRDIDKVITAGKVQMGHNTIAQPLPAAGVRQVDPFLLIHHAGPEIYKPGENALQVDAHPHRGFEPVTFVFNGEVEHKDSLGNNSVIGPGGVQWITAGKGIVHSEKASQDFRNNGGVFELIQLWINVPGSDKMSAPAYQGFTAEHIPTYLSKDKKVVISVFAGKFQRLEGPVNTRKDIQAYTALLHPGGKTTLEFDKNFNTAIYQLGGKAIINDQEINDKQLVVFKKEGGLITVEANSETRLLILAALPIGEPVFNYGPFVLNSKEEVIDAIHDYESGKMGFLND